MSKHYRVMSAANDHTPGREESRHSTHALARRKAWSVARKDGGTVWIQFVYNPGTEDEDYEKVETIQHCNL